MILSKNYREQEMASCTKEKDIAPDWLGWGLNTHTGLGKRDWRKIERQKELAKKALKNGK